MNLRLLLQTPDLAPISLSDPADGGKMHTLISPRLHLTSEDGKSEPELHGTWLLGDAGSFSTCSFQLLKAGKFSACARLFVHFYLFAHGLLPT